MTVFYRCRLSILPLIFLTFLCGCSIFPPAEYRPVSYFDIGETKAAHLENIRVDVHPFMNGSPSSLKMLYRYGKYKVSADDYNKWSMSPEIMLTRYLTSEFAGKTGDKVDSYVLTGNIISFEFDMDKMETCLSVEYQLKSEEPDKCSLKNFCTFHQKFTDKDPSALAAAMLQTVSLFAAKIKDDLKTLNRKK